MSLGRVLFGCLTVLAAALSGCGGASPDQIRAWKAAPDGPERLLGALKDDDLAPGLRAQAAAALVEIGLVDRAEGAVAAMPFEQRTQVIAGAVPLIAPQLAARDPGRAWDAREALSSLRPHATTDAARAAIDAALLPALEQDLRAWRTQGGRHTVKEMLLGLGATAVPLAHRLLADPAVPLVVLVEVLEKVAARADREKGGAALVERARKESPVPAALYRALGTLGGKEAIAFLTDRIERASDPAESDRAAEALVRIGREPSLLPVALRLARDGRARPETRDLMLLVVRNVGGDDARKGLLDMIAREPDPTYRFKAFRTVIKMVGGQVVYDALEAFPETAPLAPEVVRQEIVRPLGEMGFEPREGLFKAMETKGSSPLARMVAIWALEQAGFQSDAEHVVKLAKDRGAVKGFPPGMTVGAEAARIAAYLKKQPA